MNFCKSSSLEFDYKIVQVTQAFIKEGKIVKVSDELSTNQDRGTTAGNVKLTALLISLISRADNCTFSLVYKIHAISKEKRTFSTILLQNESEWLT